MNMQTVLRQEIPQQDFGSYVFPGTPQRPALDQKSLNIRPVIGMDRVSLRTPVEGDASLVLSYKNCESAVISIAEHAAGELWLLMQVQGAKSRKSYRVSSGMSWHKALADRMMAYAAHPDSQVQRIAMPPQHRITNLTDADEYQNASTRYAMVRQHLGLRYSAEEDLHVADITKETRAMLFREGSGNELQERGLVFLLTDHNEA